LTLRQLYRSAALRAATALGLGGVAFTLGNLILARVLSSQQYGLVSLVIGIVSVAGLAAPLGFDLAVARRGLQLDPSWRRAVLLASIATAVATAVLAAIGYHLDASLLACVLIATIATGVTQSGAAHYQGQRQFGTALWIFQFSNWALVPVALITAVLGLDTAIAPCVLITVAAVISALAAWLLVSRHRQRHEAQPMPGMLFGEALSLMTIHVSNGVLLQLERLLLAPTVGMHELAHFGVVASLVGSPFRMLQGAVLFTLMPALRAMKTVQERRRLLRREILLVTGAIAGGSIVIWIVAPPLAHWFLAGRYDLSAALMAAALVSGVLKVCSAFATGTVVALAQDKSLRALSLVSWTAIGLSVIAAFAAAPWGLVGVLYGISAGWLFRSLVAMWMAIPYLRQPVGSAPAASPPQPESGRPQPGG
jgi:O-antigen/teichoic acid export membrane protein